MLWKLNHVLILFVMMFVHHLVVPTNRSYQKVMMAFLVASLVQCFSVSLSLCLSLLFSFFFYLRVRTKLEITSFMLVFLHQW